MPPLPLITFDNISVRIGGYWAIRDLSWQIHSGENWVVWGPNGTGKSTLAKALLGQAAVVQGRVRRLGPFNSVQGDPTGPMALISSEQHTHLYLREQLLEEMAHFSGRLGGGTTAEASLVNFANVDPEYAREITADLGLDAFLSKPLTALSAGEMRKLLIGRALMAKPQILVLDEPFNGLDRAFQQRFRRMLARICSGDVQMVLITHRTEDIPDAFTHVLHLERGQVKWRGGLAEFLDDLSVDAGSSCDVRPRSRQLPLQAQKSGGTEDSGPLIRMRNVSVRYGQQQVLAGIDWTVMPGENWALIGPNGAGKSTLLRLINGDNLQGYANELTIFGWRKGSGESVWQLKQQIGYISDDLQLRYQKKMSGYDVVCSGFFDSVGLYRRCTHQQKEIASQWLETTGIEDLAGQLFLRLSYGQQRMVLIARAMVKSPRLLILDEPCNGLDPDNRKRLLHMLEVIGRTPTTNLLYVSHRPDEIPQCITHRLYIDGGRIVDAPK